MMTTFGLDEPAAMLDMAASCVGRPDWRQFAVWEGDRIIAVASVYLNGDCAGMSGAATLPEGRRRGAQSALLTARARDRRGRPGRPQLLPAQHAARRLRAALRTSHLGLARRGHPGPMTARAQTRRFSTGA